MGWTFTTNKAETKEQALERIAPEQGWDYDGQRMRFSRDKWTSEGCWGILEAKRGDTVTLRVICFARIARHGGPGYGEGGLWPEMAGPYEGGCPSHLFKIRPIYPPEGPCYATDFRARNGHPIKPTPVEAFRAAQADKRTDAEIALDAAAESVAAEIDQQRRTDAATAARMVGGAV